LERGPVARDLTKAEGVAGDIGPNQQAAANSGLNWTLRITALNL
jgi:hypothetical protein